MMSDMFYSNAAFLAWAVPLVLLIWAAGKIAGRRAK
jgi:hypothetical protein